MTALVVSFHPKPHSYERKMPANALSQTSPSNPVLNQDPTPEEARCALLTQIDNLFAHPKSKPQTKSMLWILKTAIEHFKHEELGRWYAIFDQISEGEIKNFTRFARLLDDLKIDENFYAVAGKHGAKLKNHLDKERRKQVKNAVLAHIGDLSRQWPSANWSSFRQRAKNLEYDSVGHFASQLGGFILNCNPRLASAAANHASDQEQRAQARRALDKKAAAGMTPDQRYLQERRALGHTGWN